MSGQPHRVFLLKRTGVKYEILKIQNLKINMVLALSEFDLEGQFLGFVNDTHGSFKYLRLGLTSGDVQIKLSKELRASVAYSLIPGNKIRVFGLSKLNYHSGKIKLKASNITLIDSCYSEKCPPKAKILICQKSGCRRKGGQNLLIELETILKEHGLSDQVIIERTDCFKTCKSAPNYVVQVGKKQYNNLCPEAIAHLLKYTSSYTSQVKDQL